MRQTKQDPVTLFHVQKPNVPYPSPLLKAGGWLDKYREIQEASYHFDHQSFCLYIVSCSLLSGLAALTNFNAYLNLLGYVSWLLWCITVATKLIFMGSNFSLLFFLPVYPVMQKNVSVYKGHIGILFSFRVSVKPVCDTVKPIASLGWKKVAELLLSYLICPQNKLKKISK